MLMCPRNIFPAEIWEMIFLQVETPLDKLSLIRSHSSFQSQFEDYEEDLLLVLVRQHEIELATPLEPEGMDDMWKSKQHSFQLLLEYSKKLKKVTLDLKLWFTGAPLTTMGTHGPTFPRLPYLEQLKLSWVHNLVYPTKALESIRMYLPQLVTLEFNDLQDFPLNFLEEDLLPKLSNLKLSSQTKTIRHSNAEIQVRKIFRKITVRNLSKIQITFKNPNQNERYGFLSSGQVAQIKTIFFFCLNKLNKFCSRLNPDNQFLCSNLLEETGVVKITFSRTLPVD